MHAIIRAHVAELLTRCRKDEGDVRRELKASNAKDVCSRCEAIGRWMIRRARRWSRSDFLAIRGRGSARVEEEIWEILSKTGYVVCLLYGIGHRRARALQHGKGRRTWARASEGRRRAASSCCDGLVRTSEPQEGGPRRGVLRQQLTPLYVGRTYEGVPAA